MTDEAKKALTGLQILGIVAGTSMPEDRGTVMGLVLTGSYDNELLAAFSSAGHTKPQQSLDNMKDMIRRGVQRDVQRLEEEARQVVVDNVKEINKPHPAGTTAEIAQKLGVSKNEVRRMKAAGTLNDALKEAE